MASKEKPRLSVVVQTRPRGAWNRRTARCARTRPHRTDPSLSNPRNGRCTNLRWPGLKKFCSSLEPFASKCVMRFEAPFCPHTGLRLPDPPRAGFSLGATRLIRVRIQRGQTLEEPDLPLFGAL